MLKRITIEEDKTYLSIGYMSRHFLVTSSRDGAQVGITELQRWL